MNLQDKLTTLALPYNATILDALKKMDLSSSKLLIVLKNDKFLSLLSIGDIQRALLAQTELSSEVQSILRKKVLVAHKNDTLDKIKKSMLDGRAEFMPVIDEHNNIVNIVLWSELFAEQAKPVRKSLNLPTVIMAGGKGTRLQPFTNIIPKPMIPIKDKSMIELIMGNFAQVGTDTFHITVNYKAEMLEYYLKSLNLKYTLNFVKEDTPLGTAGSLALLKDKLSGTFFVSNCDILIDQDYSEVYDYHVANKNDITVISALKHIEIPYGVLNTKENGVLSSLQEKPNLSYQINSGVYILESSVLELIPEKRLYHITHLIEQVMKNGGKVGVFPVNESAWLDVGQWSEYQKTQGQTH